MRMVGERAQEGMGRAELEKVKTTILRSFSIKENRKIMSGWGLGCGVKERYCFVVLCL